MPAQPKKVIKTPPHVNHKYKVEKGRRIFGERKVEYLWEVKHVAERFKVSAASVLVWVRTGQLTAYKICKNPDVPAAEARTGPMYFTEASLVRFAKIRHDIPLDEDE